MIRILREIKSGDRTAILKIHRPGVYCLEDTQNPYNKRWGNKKEILEDVAHFEQFSRLPSPKGGHW